MKSDSVQTKSLDKILTNQMKITLSTLLPGADLEQLLTSQFEDQDIGMSDLLSSLADTQHGINFDFKSGNQEDFFNRLDYFLAYIDIGEVNVGLYVLTLGIIPLNCKPELLSLTNEIYEKLTPSLVDQFYRSIAQRFVHQKQVQWSVHFGLFIFIYMRYAGIHHHEYLYDSILAKISTHPIADKLVNAVDLVLDSLRIFLANTLDELKYPTNKSKTKSQFRTAHRNPDKVDQFDWDDFKYKIDLLQDEPMTIIATVRDELRSGTLRTGLLSLGRATLVQHTTSTMIFTKLMDLLFEVSSDEEASHIIDLLIIFLDHQEIDKNSHTYHQYLVQAVARSVTKYSMKIPEHKLQRFFILSISRWVKTRHRKQLVNYGYKATKSKEFLEVALEDNAKSVRDLAQSYLDQLE